jgi:Zn-dependent protease/predicted transcriptional regulator
MRGGIHLGHIAGIGINIDWSLLIIFLLILLSLGQGVFPTWHPDWPPETIWTTAFTAAILFFVSILLHELSHAIVGRANGIRVNRITLFMFGGMAEMENEPPSWKAEFSMAIVGPITSVIIGVACLWLGQMLAGPLAVDPENPQHTFAHLGAPSTLLFWLGSINILLAIFNMVPGFPLDGGRVLRSFLWGISGSRIKATHWASGAGQAVAWLLMATGFVMIIGIQVPFFGAGLIGGLWLILIGWFLNSAAIMSYRQLLVQKSLGNVPVERIMQRELATVNPGMRLIDFVNDHLMKYGQRVFAVEDNGRCVGIISWSDVRKSDRRQWESVRINDIMTPLEHLVTTSPRQDAFDALELLGHNNLNQLPVLEQGQLVGLIHREDILKWLFLNADGKNTTRAFTSGND